MKFNALPANAWNCELFEGGDLIFSLLLGKILVVPGASRKIGNYCILFNLLGAQFKDHTHSN